VAVVAAETKDAATPTARLVRVEYEKPPAVVTIAAPLDPTAPLVRRHPSEAAAGCLRPAYARMAPNSTSPKTTALPTT
jgi:CO/xanthine dehydrogenase Mo-binding subunit